MSSGMIGGIIGGVIGILAGLFGTYCSVRNTNGPKEKAFMIKAAIIGWVAIIIFLLLLFYLPKPYNFLMWIPYGIALPIAIVKLNKKQQQIREEEKTSNTILHPPQSKNGVIGGTIGATIGSIAWIVITGIAIKSFLFTLLPLFLGLICIVMVIKLYKIQPERAFAIMGLAILWLVIVNFAFGNLIYDNIPETFCGLSTNKSQFSLLHLNVLLGLLSIMGFWFIIKDILSKK